MGILSADVNNNKLDHVNVNEDERETFIPVIHMDIHSRL